MPTSPRLLLVLLLAVLALSSCGPLAASTPTPSPLPPTLPPRPTATPPPTATPRPVVTRLPTATRPAVPTVVLTTATVAPTAPPTAEPTATSRPTAASTEVPAATATPEIVLTPLSQLPSLSGQEVTVQANIVWISSFSKGFNFLLDDGTGQATLLMWLDVYDDCWAAPNLIVGATVRAHGTVGQYQGTWQVEAGFGGDVKVLSPGNLPPLRQIGSITESDLTTRVTVEGAVSKVEPFSQGQRVYVDDGTGTILVLLWQNIFDRVQNRDRLLTPGTRVRVDGALDEYKGTIELVPQVPYNVVVLP